MATLPLPVHASTAFGPAFVSLDFDEAVESFIREWIDSYLSEIEVRRGLERRTVDRPKSYNVAVDVDHWPEEQLPGVLVVSAGFPSDLDRVGGGVYDGWLEWVAVVILTGRDYPSIRQKTSIYQAALRLMFTQKLDEAVGTTELLAEPSAYAPVEGRDRTRGVVAFQFRTYVEAIADGGLGPSVPDDPAPPDDPSSPHDDLPTVQTVDIELTPLDD